MSADNISRKEFLGLSRLVAAGMLLPDLNLGTTEKEIKPDPFQNAVRLPTLEYHDPNFNAGDACMTPEVFEAQLDWLEKAGYYTPKAEEVAGFLKGEKLLPYNSVVIRFDLGTDKLDPDTKKSVWPQVFENLRKRNLHALIFLIPDTVGTLKDGLSWHDLAFYTNSGTLSICSHGLADHPNYQSISEEYALYSMQTSRKRIETGLKEGGVANPQVLGFAFPFDSVPSNAPELVEKAGFKFFASGVKINGLNAAEYKDINEGLPVIYPYVYRRDIQSREENARNNYALLPIKGGRSFIDTLVLNQNEFRNDESWEKYKLNIWRQKMLPEEIFTNRLISPLSIIVHTDSQRGDVQDWKSEKTFNGVDAENRKIAVTFGVDQKGPLQFVPLYLREGRLFIPEPLYDSQAAKEVSPSINIEMAGDSFDQILENGEKDKKAAVLLTIANTAILIAQIIKISNGQLNENRVFGHFEMTIKGKSDPGEKTMIVLREMIRGALRPALRPDIKKYE